MNEEKQDLQKELNELKTLKKTHEKLYSLHLKTITIVVAVAAVILGYISIESSKDIDQAKNKIDDKLTQIQEQINQLTKDIYKTNNDLVKDNYEKIIEMNESIKNNFTQLENSTENKIEKNISDFEERVNEITNEGIKYPELQILYEGDSLNNKEIWVQANKIYRITDDLIKNLNGYPISNKTVSKIKKSLLNKNFVDKSSFINKLKNTIGDSVFSEIGNKIVKMAIKDKLKFNASSIHFKNVGNKIATNISARLYLSNEINLEGWTKIDQAKENYISAYWVGGGEYIGISPNEDWIFAELKGQIAQENTLKKINCRLEVYYGQKDPSIAEFTIEIISIDN